MVKPALRRSARIRRNKNNCEDREPEIEKFIGLEQLTNKGEPKSKRQRVRVPGKSEKVSSNRDDNYPEVGETSKSQEVCSTLPVEILEMIFTQLKRDFEKDVLGEFKNEKFVNLRLVCKKWCDILSTNQKVYFAETVPHAPFENCGFQRFSLCLWRVDLSKLPLSTWEKIGNEVNSLTLIYCTIGDQGLKNIIVHCCNLHSLKMFLEDNEESVDPFCSLDMLRGLQITRKNLGTFEIFNTRQKTVDVTKWVQIFEVFFKVFPNVTNFTSGCGENPEVDETFQFKFLKELDEDDASGIAASLAFSLSTNRDHHRQALNASSSLRLSDVSVGLWKSNHNYYNNEDETMLIEFFSSHKNLNCIEIILNERSTTSGLVATLPLKILEKCSKLRKFKYCENNYADWFHTLSEHEFAQLRTVCSSHLEELSINCFKFFIKRSSLSSVCHHQLNYGWDKPLWEKRLRGFVTTTYPDLQHLDVPTFPCSDDTLQKIFKHLINLKTLSIKIDFSNTNVGITGHCGDAPGVFSGRTVFKQQLSTTISGYSINRLKNLEELTIVGYDYARMNDSIFYEFNFPKLRFLSIEPPDDPPKLLPIMGKNMPSIEKIDFRSRNRDYKNRKNFQNSAKSLVFFCQLTNKLREITLRTTSLKCDLSESEIIEVFNICPSLRLLIEEYNKVSYFDPITQKVVIRRQ